MNPKVSIIIPNYNHAIFLVQRLDSVFNQTFQDFEVILLDDKSTDESLVILNQYANHPKVSHLVINKENSGSPFKQWQKGIKLAKGEYIWIAESDDYCELTFLKKLVNYSNEDHSNGIIYCQTNDIDENGVCLNHRINYTNRFQPNIWEMSFVKDGKEFVESYLSFFNVIPNASAVLFRRELLENSIFSSSLTDMKMCGDWYFWIQIALKSKVCFLSETLNYFRDHQSVSRNHKDIQKKKLRLFEEKVVRSFMHSKQIINLKSEYLLYLKWFDLHGYQAIYTKSFYDIKLKNISFFSFVKMYIKNKFTLHKLIRKFAILA
ncbi:glycosyltransferase family 2 protein [Flavobacterium aquicola]|uniref:Glycosyltransferase involved in cell wall biosynthesis n=1 Tax=Flavobacterium aquicola TaxID=1682742 RepID=A0A3E0EJD0_9FLAO|nr:glycosyltransferase [Flavobacterium aquicola]REG98265.1 glycosyltransferase involved in cell wall biosynthesis [Flavobacterium aquicola]